jgi:methylenetetrahydrofolate reductase (NADPH)
MISLVSDEEGVGEETWVCRDVDFAKEMAYLKQKVDAGADMIITQMFFDTPVFVTFVKACREMGIECPIIPGLMCIGNYGGFMRMYVNYG